MLGIVFTNDGTGNETIGNYDYCVYVGGRLIAEGRVENHVRAEGWEGLVQKLAEEVMK